LNQYGTLLLLCHCVRVPPTAGGPHPPYPAHSGWKAAGHPSQHIRSPPDLHKRGSSKAGAVVQLAGHRRRGCLLLLILHCMGSWRLGTLPAGPAAPLIAVSRGDTQAAFALHRGQQRSLLLHPEHFRAAVQKGSHSIRSRTTRSLFILPGFE
jgi:hypothetical protein